MFCTYSVMSNSVTIRVHPCSSVVAFFAFYKLSLSPNSGTVIPALTPHLSACEFTSHSTPLSHAETASPIQAVIASTVPAGIPARSRTSRRRTPRPINTDPRIVKHRAPRLCCNPIIGPARNHPTVRSRNNKRTCILGRGRAMQNHKAIVRTGPSCNTERDSS